MHNQEPSQHPVMDDQNLEAQDYQNFDDFAQRGSQAEQRQLFSQSLVCSKVS